MDSKCPDFKLKFIKYSKKIMAKYINGKMSKSKFFHVNENRFTLMQTSNEEHD